MLNVKISIDNGNGKKAEIELSDSDNISKLMIIQNVFNLFGVNSDMLEMTKTYDQIGKAYKSFFNEVDPVEPNTTSKEVNNDIKEDLIKSYTENNEILGNVYKEKDEQLNSIYTGIKIKDGKQLYKLHYKCPACYNKGSHYIYHESTNTWCHRCRHEMPVSPAHPEGFPNRDTFGNYFRAGDFEDWNV
ncbi:MAG: hypothetical protein ACQEXX_01090 [Bacillota bacterium]